MVSAVLCFDGGLRGEVGVVGFRVARVVLTQNSSQSSPLSRMKLVFRGRLGTIRRVVGAWFWDGGGSGSGGRDLLCVEILVSEESSSVDESESSEPDSEESDSSVVS